MSKNNYVDKKELHDAIVEWLEQRKEDENAQMSEFIGDAIIKIATGFCKQYNYAGYTWNDEMIGDAIVNTVRYLHNYNPSKYDNPHAYISMCCESAAKGRLNKEEANLAVRYKYFVDNFDIHDENFDAEMSDDFMNDIQDKIGKHEKKRQARKEKRRKKQMNKGNNGLDI